MRHRSQLSPISVTHESQVRAPLNERPVAPSANWEGVRLFRCRLVYDSSRARNLRPVLTPRHLNWSSVLGLGLATVVSASIWAGIAWTVAMVWK